MRGGLTSVQPEKLFRLAYAKSASVFEQTGEGEQVFLAPRPGSRILLIDDLKVAVPVLTESPFAILETSPGNFQHFYTCERGLDVDQRHQLQNSLAKEFGGDLAAASGSQPHRCPGSVNYKPGRDLFVARLVAMSTAGKPLACPTETETEKETRVSPPNPPKRAAMGRVGGMLMSPSEVDWQWVKTHRNLGEVELVRQLAARAASRGKHADYARRTVIKALSRCP